MTKKFNKGSRNQNSPRAGHAEAEFANEFVSGDNSKGNQNNHTQKKKVNENLPTGESVRKKTEA